MATVEAVCTSAEKGKRKDERDGILLVEGLGIDGDAHRGNWHRQVSLLASESVAAMRGKCSVPLTPGVFAENILTSGIELKSLPVGTRLKVADCILEVTQIGKECHSDCEIRKLAGFCVMPLEGIFSKVIKGGTVRKGDEIIVL